MQTTSKERAVLTALRHSHYGEDGHGVWSWAANDSNKPADLSDHAVAGVLSSLQEKDLVSIEEYDVGENIIYITDAGRTAEES